MTTKSDFINFMAAKDDFDRQVEKLVEIIYKHYKNNRTPYNIEYELSDDKEHIIITWNVYYCGSEDTERYSFPVEVLFFDKDAVIAYLTDADRRKAAYEAEQKRLQAEQKRKDAELAQEKKDKADYQRYLELKEKYER